MLFWFLSFGGDMFCVFVLKYFQGTQIQATMFNDAARKFYDKFVMGKVYYISKGSLKVANKQYKTVANDYEMTLNENSEVEEVANEAAFVPETKFNFVPIDQLGPYVNKSELVGECWSEVMLPLFVLLLLLSSYCSFIVDFRCCWSC